MDEEGGSQGRSLKGISRTIYRVLSITGWVCIAAFLVTKVYTFLVLAVVLLVLETLSRVSPSFNKMIERVIRGFGGPRSGNDPGK